MENDRIIVFFSFLVNNQKDIENQLGIRITDSGIGNPRQVSLQAFPRHSSSFSYQLHHHDNINFFFPT